MPTVSFFNIVLVIFGGELQALLRNGEVLISYYLGKKIFVHVSPSYVYYTQIMQAETLASAYRLWRRNWRGRGREHTAGALVWQVCEFHNSHSLRADLRYQDE
jgi:hypothetical protein